MKPHILLLLLVSQPSFASKESLSKKEFFEEMKKKIPEEFCLEHRYFRKCFSITEENCKKIVVVSSKECLSLLEKELPQTLKIDEGVKWGAKIGECVGGKYETSQLKSKIEVKLAPDCKDPSKWKN